MAGMDFMSADTSKMVFISYRRDVTPVLADSIKDKLVDLDYDVFLDIDDIGAGDFDEIILTQIEAREHFIILLAKGSLKRCSKPGDWLRREIEFAIDKKRNIIPIMYEDFDFKSKNIKKLLTGKLNKLSGKNGVEWRRRYRKYAMEDLCNKYLSKRAKGIIVPAPPETESTVREITKKANERSEPTEAQLTAEQLFIQAYGKQESGHLDGAIEDYTEAIGMNPDFAYAYNNRGSTYSERSEFDTAIADFDKAIELDPQLAQAHYNRGNAYAEKDEFDTAIADYDKAIGLDPQYAQAYNNRGNAYAEKDEIDKAINDYDKSIEIDPQFSTAYHNRGSIYKETGQLEQAIDDYSRAIEIDPQYVDAHINRGVIYYSEGKSDSAIADYINAIELAPQNAMVYNNRGEAYFQQGKYRNALADFEKANSLSPGDNFVLAGMAITHHALGNVDEAGRLWRVLVAIDKRYLDAEWVKTELGWHDVLVDEARKVIAAL
jgi:tetratricopeptide (TPR) repeat protein